MEWMRTWYAWSAHTDYRPDSIFTWHALSLIYDTDIVLCLLHRKCTAWIPSKYQGCDKKEVTSSCVQSTIVRVSVNTHHILIRTPALHKEVQYMPVAPFTNMV